jgi:hypothetical protein
VFSWIWKGFSKVWIRIGLFKIRIRIWMVFQRFGQVGFARYWLRFVKGYGELVFQGILGFSFTLLPFALMTTQRCNNMGPWKIDADAMLS